MTFITRYIRKKAVLIPVFFLSNMIGNVPASSLAWETFAIPQSIGLVGKGLYGKALTEADLRSMDTMCKHVLAHFILVGFESGSAFPQDSPLLSRPEFAMVKGVPFMHHYCDAKLEKFRYESSLKPEVRAKSLEKWGKGMQYCINSADYNYKDWPYRNVLYTEMAEYNLHDGKAQQAIAFALKAIDLNDKYVPSYAIAADAYVQIGKKAEAVKILELGIEKSINNKPLRNRYKRLTGIAPPITVVPDNSPLSEPSKAAAENKAEANAPPTKSIETHPQARQAQSDSKTEQQPVASQPTQSTTVQQNLPADIKSPLRSCRFCPDL